VPAEYKKWVAERMRNRDMSDKKKKKSKSKVWREFIVPQPEHYEVLLS
jgi:hypothetical protein